MTILGRRTVVLAEIESSYGVDPTPSASTDAILCSNPTLSVDGTVLTRDFVRESMSPLPHVIGRKLVNISFEAEVKGNTSINTTNPIEVDAVLRACGLQVTYSTTGAGTAQYKPRSSSFESATLYVYVGEEAGTALLYEINGAYGTAEMTAEAGNFGRISFNLTGLYNEPVGAALPTPTFSSVLPAIFENANASIHGFSGVVAQSVTVALNNTIAERPDINSAAGLAGVRITGRDTQGTINPEQELETTHPFWSRWTSASQGIVHFEIGSNNGQKAVFHATNTQYQALNWGDRDGIRTYEIPLRIAENTGDDEFTLTFHSAT